MEGCASWLKVLLCLVLLEVFVVPGVGRSDVYQYEDDKGAVTFTDNPGAVPKKFKKKMKGRGVDFAPADLSETRVSVDGKRVIVPVTIAYLGKEIEARLILDTGAEVTTINPALAKRLGFRPGQGGITYAQGVGGITAASHITLDSLQLGPQKKYSLDALVVKAGSEDGLLGMNFLGGLRYQINFDMGTIKWVNK